MAYVVVFPHGDAAQRVSLKPSTIIGRSLECDIWLHDPQLSRRHCKIERVGNAWVLTDLRSRNGTLLARGPIVQHTLQDGETIYAGGARIVFHADQRLSSHRPDDPSEALRARQLQSRQAALQDTQIQSTPDRLPSPRVRATPIPKTVDQIRQNQKPAISLPFTRPPARPIVRGRARAEDPGVSSSWFSAAVQRLRRRDNRRS